MILAPEQLLQIHAFATLAMVGVIWTCQLVHYPLFARVGRSEFPEYERDHMRRIVWIVGPLMIVELATAAWLAFDPPATLLTHRHWIWTGLAAVLLIWLSTATLQGPTHTRLARTPEPRLIRFLVATNWIRTILWTSRGVLALWLIEAANP